MRTDDEQLEVESEERAIYAIIVAAMLPVVIGLSLAGGVISGGNALSLLLVALGVVGLFAGLRAVFVRKLPRASARFTRPR